MDTKELNEFAGDPVVLMWPYTDYGKRVCQGRLLRARVKPDEWELWDSMAPHDYIHPKFRANDVGRVVTINDNHILLMVYPEDFSAVARKSELLRRRQLARGGPYGAIT